jgi:hypothetical protein
MARLVEDLRWADLLATVNLPAALRAMARPADTAHHPAASDLQAVRPA